MPRKKTNLPKQLRLGRNKKSCDAQPPKYDIDKGRYGIKTDVPDINWTFSRLTITIIVLCIPYLIAVILSFAVKNYLIAGVFVGIGLLVIGMYFLIRFLDKADL